MEDRLTVEIIPDGVHVHPLLVEKTFRCKGIERIAFITDGVKGAGNPPGVYDGLYPGVQVEVTADRGVRRTSDNALSGSALTPIQCLRNAVQQVRPVAGRGLDPVLTDARAGIGPAAPRVLLAAGMDADIIIVTKDLDVVTTICCGEVLYQA